MPQGYSLIESQGGCYFDQSESRSKYSACPGTSEVCFLQNIVCDVDTYSTYLKFHNALPKILNSRIFILKEYDNDIHVNI